MASGNVPSDSPSESSDDAITNFSSLTELRLGVTADATLGCVCILVDGLGDGYSCLMAPPHAIEMAAHLTGHHAAAPARAGPQPAHPGAGLALI